jgi:hypothetical protein
MGCMVMYFNGELSVLQSLSSNLFIRFSEVVTVSSDLMRNDKCTNN